MGHNLTHCTRLRCICMLFTKSKSIFNEPSNRHGSAGVHWRLYNHIVHDHDYIKPVRHVSARLTLST